MILDGFVEVQECVGWEWEKVRFDVEILIYNDVFSCKVTVDEYAGRLIEVWDEVFGD